MKNNNEKLIKKISEKQDYNKMLLKLIKNQRNHNINNLLNEIYEDENIPNDYKITIYETIFAYVKNINDELKNNIKVIFETAVRETIQYTHKKSGENSNEI